MPSICLTGPVFSSMVFDMMSSDSGFIKGYLSGFSKQITNTIVTDAEYEQKSIETKLFVTHHTSLEQSDTIGMFYFRRNSLVLPLIREKHEFKKSNLDLLAVFTIDTPDFQVNYEFFDKHGSKLKVEILNRQESGSIKHQVYTGVGAGAQARCQFEYN